MNFNSDVIFVHPPTNFEANAKPVALWPISEVIPSSPTFEMYPYGFLTMAEYLERHGFSTKIYNLALMYLRENIDVHDFATKLDVELVAIDLHWMVHASGSLTLAKIIKEHNPETPVLFGGLSSTYYYKELIRNPFIDFIIRGDSCEKPLLELMRAIMRRDREEFDNIPNLVWKKNGRVVDNGIKWVEEDLDDILEDPDVLPQLLLSRNLESLPYRGFMENPIVPVFTVRGCSLNCATCGGSEKFYKRFCRREKLAFRSPKKIVRDLKTYNKYGDFPIFLIGDLRQGGEKYWKNVARGIKDEEIDSKLVLELFSPARKEFYEEFKGVDRVNIQISPETYDEDLRARQRTRFTNNALEKNLRWGIESGVNKFDVYFMIGIAGQNEQEVKNTVDYTDELLSIGDEIHSFIAPLAPFVDPGSPAFEKPSSKGFKILFKDISSHVEAMKSDAWENSLNYETRTLGRREIVENTYEALSQMAQKKKIHQRINEKEYEQKVLQLKLSREANRRIRNGGDPQRILNEVKTSLDSISSTGDLYWGSPKLSLTGLIKAAKRKMLSMLPF